MPVHRARSGVTCRPRPPARVGELQTDEQVGGVEPRVGVGSDPATGAVSTPIHPSSTYAHPGLGETTGYDYARTGNPTRQVLEQALGMVKPHAA